MTLSPLSLSNSGNRCLPLVLLALIWSVGELPVKAQLSEILPSTEIAQSSDSAKEKQLQTKAEDLINLLGSQDYPKVRETLSPELQPEWPPQKIEKIWQELLSQTGGFKKVLDSKVIETVNADIVTLSVEFEKTTGDFLVTFNLDRQIVGVDFPKTESIQKIAEKFVKDLAAGDFASARGYLHPFLKTEVFPEKIQRGWQELLSQTGPFTRIVGYEIRTGSATDNVDVVVVTMEFEKITDDLLVIFNDKKQITGVDFPEMN